MGVVFSTLCKMETHTLYDRDGTNKRAIVINTANGHAHVTMHNTVWCTITGEPDSIEAVDPDGGPFIHVGMQLGKWKLTRLYDYKEIDDPITEEQTITVSCDFVAENIQSDRIPFA